MMTSGLQNTPWIWGYSETCCWLHTELLWLYQMSWRSQASMQIELKCSVVCVAHITFSFFPVFFHVASVVKLKGYGFCVSTKPSEIIAVMIIVPKGFLRLDIFKPLCMKGNPVGWSVFKFSMCPYWVLRTLLQFFVCFQRTLRALDRKRQKNKSRKATVWLLGLTPWWLLLHPVLGLKVSQLGESLLHGLSVVCDSPGW